MTPEQLTKVRAWANGGPPVYPTRGTVRDLLAEVDRLREEQAVYYAQADRLIASEAHWRRMYDDSAAWAGRLLKAKLAAEARLAAR